MKPQHYQAGWSSCYVETRVNTQAVLNEEDHTEQHWLQCHEETDEDHPTAISVHFTEHGDLRVTLYGRGVTEETGEMIAVAIRIDDAPTIRREVPLDGDKIAAIQEPAFAHMLLALLATGERAVIGVGSRSGLILLTAEVQAAGRDFQSRLPREECSGVSITPDNRKCRLWKITPAQYPMVYVPVQRDQIPSGGLE